MEGGGGEGGEGRIQLSCSRTAYTYVYYRNIGIQNVQRNVSTVCDCEGVRV